MFAREARALGPVDKAIWYVESHFRQEITLDSVAQDGRDNILGLALDVGYGSHEAFSRAFREQFGLSHEVRQRRSVAGLDLREAITINGTTIAEPDEPRIVDGNPLLLAGISKNYTHETMANVPAQWQQCQPYLGRVPGQVGHRAYGVIYNGDDDCNYDYPSAVEVAEFNELPKEFERLWIPAQ